MPLTYRSKYGIDFPAEYSDLFIDMTLAKKWRLYRDNGFDVSGFDPGDCLERAVRELWPSEVAMSPWTRTILHDFAAEDKYAMIGCGSCGKSYALAACSIVYWATDPFDTAVVIGSSTLTDLKTRAWGPTLKLFSALKNNRAGFSFPGKIVNNVYAIVNEKDESIAESQSQIPSIQGRALDEGRTQGLHAAWVLFVVDELGIIRDMEALKSLLTNSRIGTLGHKFVSAANPNPWDSPNSCYYVPPAGVSVDVDTGSWRSAMGYFVRHFDGLKSPVVRDPRLKSEFPFLMSQHDVDSALAECGGDPDAPIFWRMVRGFPLSSGAGYRTVLDAAVAAGSRAAEPMPQAGAGRRRIGLCAGIDPAWTEAGDAAVYAGCDVVEQDGRVYLDFGGRVSRLPISAKSSDPVTKQLRDAAVARIVADGGPPLRQVYVDASGNQGLADDLDIYVGGGCGHINSSVRASDRPLRALDGRPAREHIYDRGAEAWCVLAEFVRAGQVRGLPQAALDALVRRRFMCRPKTSDPVDPLRLEAKDRFIARFRGSPNHCDACALAALAAKERLGVAPFGGRPAPSQAGVTGYARPPAPPPTPPPAADYGAEPASGEWGA